MKLGIQIDDDKTPNIVGITVFQKKGCLSKNTSNHVGKYKTQTRVDTESWGVRREVVSAEGFIRRWDVR